MQVYHPTEIERIWVDEVWLGEHVKNAEEGWRIIKQKYSRAELTFHNLSHIGEQLAFLSSHDGMVAIKKRRALLAAVILHEIGHDPRGGSSETKSCAFIKRMMPHLVPEGLLDDICCYIAATDPKSDKVPVGDQEIMHDLEFCCYIKDTVLVDNQRYHDEYGAFCVKEAYSFRRATLCCKFAKTAILKAAAFQPFMKVRGWQYHKLVETLVGELGDGCDVKEMLRSLYFMKTDNFEN